MFHPRYPDIRLLSLYELQAYAVSTTMYDQRHATALWITMTAYLPVDMPDIFVVVTEQKDLLPVEEYLDQFSNLPYISSRREHMKEARIEWRVGRSLVEHFGRVAHTWGSDRIYGYGDASKALMTDWYNFLQY